MHSKLTNYVECYAIEPLRETRANVRGSEGRESEVEGEGNSALAMTTQAASSARYLPVITTTTALEAAASVQQQ